MTESEVNQWWRSLDDDTRINIADDYGLDTYDPDEEWFNLSWKRKLKIYKSENR